MASAKPPGSTPASKVATIPPSQQASTNSSSFGMAWKTSRWPRQRAANSRTIKGSALNTLPKASAPGIA